MTISEVPLPTISTMFDDYFSASQSRAQPLTGRRIAAVRVHLEAYLDEHAAGILTTLQLQILHAEQQFNPEGAFVRTMHPEDLYYSFYGYLKPEYRLPGLVDAGIQLRVVDGLARWMWTRGLLVDLNRNSCIVLDVEGAIKRARRELAVAREEQD
ncbi:MAG: hypothetical protein JWQ43_2823 [Glaciihabitans sp.]|nr:hypothetical protein [Glaciihabitans sp.]